MRSYPPELCYPCSCGRENFVNAVLGDFNCECGRLASCQADVPLEVDPESKRYIIIRKAKGFGRGTRRAKGAWMSQVESGAFSVYVSCVRCGTINDLSDAAIDNLGYCHCFYCGQCGCDHFVRLEGFRPPLGLPFKHLRGSVIFEGGRVFRR